jgi:histidine triad (HIT) family protein
MASDCIFCRIIAGAAPASIVYRDAVCLAFMDIQPVNPGHLLVVPLAHAAGLSALDALTAGHLMQVGQRLGGALLNSGLRCEGVNYFIADGEAAGQEVFHVHLHVIPRFAEDGFGFRFPPAYFQRPPRAELDSAAARIVAALAPPSA